MKPVKAHHYLFLDGLRGVAAILVMQRHAAERFGGYVFGSSYLAVDFFFVLSGFVIAHAYGEKLATDMSFVSFMERRIVRLYPVFLIGIVVMVLARLPYIENHHLAMLPELMATTAFNLLYLPAPAMFAFNGPFLVGPFWSLSSEMFANIIYAPLAKLRSAPVAMIAATIFGLIAVVATAGRWGSLDVGFDYANLAGGLARVMFSFFAGVLICRFREKVPEVGGRLCAGACVVLLALVLMPTIEKEYRMGYDLVVTLLLFPVIVALGSRVAVTGVVKSASVLLGEISYPVYAIHLPIAVAMVTVCPSIASMDGSAETDFLVIAFMAAICIIAWLLVRYIDVPIRAAVTGWLQQKRRAQFA